MPRRLGKGLDDVKNVSGKLRDDAEFARWRRNQVTIQATGHAAHGLLRREGWGLEKWGGSFLGLWDWRRI